jgi:hypothetical protein
MKGTSLRMKAAISLFSSNLRPPIILARQWDHSVRSRRQSTNFFDAIYDKSWTVQSGTLAKELETLHHVTATSGPDPSTNEWKQVENMRLPHHALDLGFLRLQFIHDSFNILYPLLGRSSLSPCTKMVGGYCYCHLFSSIVLCVVVTMVVAIGRWSESWSRYWPEETWRTWRTWRLAVGRWKEEGRVWLRGVVRLVVLRRN